MGMFDRIWVQCPRCNADVEFQSKADSCTLQDFTLATVPTAVAADLIGEESMCHKCNWCVTIHGQYSIWAM